MESYFTNLICLVRVWRIAQSSCFLKTYTEKRQTKQQLMGPWKKKHKDFSTDFEWTFQLPICHAGLNFCIETMSDGLPLFSGSRIEIKIPCHPSQPAIWLFLLDANLPMASSKTLDVELYNPFRWKKQRAELPFRCHLKIDVHPGKLTWNLKMDPWKRRFLLETIIFRCYVSFREGKTFLPVPSIDQHGFLPASPRTFTNNHQITSPKNCTARCFSMHSIDEKKGLYKKDNHQVVSL